MPHEAPLITLLAFGLVLAFLLGSIAWRLKLSPIVGYLLAGILAGPFTPGFVGDLELAPQLAEIGVILLMFGVGLHFSLGDLLKVRAIAIPGAMVQIAVATLLGWGLAAWLGWNAMQGLVFGLALSCASTVVLLRAMEDQRLLDTTGFRTQRLPLDRSGESQTLDAKVASKKLLGEFTRADLGGLSFWTQPNSWNHFMSDHIVTFSVIPLSAGKTLVRTKWLVHKDAVEGVDYDVKNLTAVWNATNDQDHRLVEFSQRGAASSAYEPGPYSPYTEGLVEKFCDWYVTRVAEHLGVAIR